MLNSLDVLAGKISPGSIDGQLENTVPNELKLNHHLNHNSIHPYVKPNFNHNNHSNEHELNSICNKHKIMDVNNMKELNETNLNLNNNNNSTTLNNNNILNNITDNDNINLEFDNNLLLNSSMDGDQLEINSNDSLMSGDQPDPDYIKMFVGQVPKSMDEEQLKTMFEEYGRVHTINVLRDKVTGISKDNRSITPWMVNIQKYNLVGGSKGYVYHCAGVLYQSGGFIGILMSEKCFTTFPANSQMVFFAGGQHKLKINYKNYKNIQKFLPTRHLLPGINAQTGTFFQPPIEQTNYVDFITKCSGEQCKLDAVGYQYGWSNNPNIGVHIVQYNFSNSFQLCLETNEPDDKFCTYHDCALDVNESNSGGEVLTKNHEGVTYLMGFWDYDECDKNIRVFAKLKQTPFY